MRTLVEALRARRFSLSGIIVSVAGVAFLFVLFLDSSVGRIIAAIIAGGAIVVLALYSRQTISGMLHRGKEDVYNHPPRTSMKTLLFDDYQSSEGGKCVVKEISVDDGVVPSTKTVAPVPVTPREERARQFEVSDFFDLDSDIYHSEVEPKSEFNFLLHKTLAALRDVTFAHSTAFYWVNRDKQQLVLEAKVTDSQNFSGEKRFALDRDIISQVAGDGRPQFHGRMTPVSEKELIRYYESPEYVKSVIAVPVFYLNASGTQLPVAVIVADSKAEDAFGAETLGLLGKFTKLVSGLIRSYTGKYDLLLDSELLTSLRRMDDRIKADPSEYSVLTSLSDELNRLLNWDVLTVAMYDEERQGWMLQKVVNKTGGEYVGPDQMIDFTASIVGKAIRANRVERIDSPAGSPVIRFHREEPAATQGTFICVPISSFNRCYGALTLESRHANNFTGKEVETVYRLVEKAAGALEVLYMNDLVKDYVIVDQLTGSFNHRHFMKRFEEEVQRSADFGEDLALVTVVIDEAEEIAARYGKEGFDTVLNQVARILRGSIRSYDVIGRLEGNNLGVCIVNTAASDAFLWAEKMRKQIASHIISVGDRSFSVTISAGVCGLMEGMQKDQLLHGTSQVLHQAREGGGNLVRVF